MSIASCVYVCCVTEFRGPLLYAIFRSSINSKFKVRGLALGLGSTALQLRISAWSAVTVSAAYGDERSTPVDDCCAIQRSRRISQAIAYFVKEAI